MDKAPVNVSPFTDKQGTHSCCAQGACIETTLLTDLSEEERSRLAEHCKLCSACARRFQRYEVIEGFAGELPLYDLGSYTRYSSWIRAAQLKAKRQGKICTTIILLVRSIVRSMY